MLGVSTRTVALWARTGKLRTGVLTPGGHRRYRRADALSLLENANGDADAARKRMEEDAARLYEQGWSIRQVAEQFECGYSTMRQILHKRTSLRNRGGATA
jgi:transposase